jgi:hypothetical protein
MLPKNLKHWLVYFSILLGALLMLTACADRGDQSVSNQEPVSPPAAGSSTAAVTGIVSDVDGKPLAEVGVAVKEGSVATPEKLALTGADGKYIWNLPVGTFKLAANKDGYAGQVLDVEVKAGDQQVELNFKLEKAP